MRRESTEAVRLCHAASRRELPARCLDVSEGGLLLALPATAPLREGHAVEILPSGQAAEVLASAGRPAVVVRVDRARLVVDGWIAVAVRFA